MKTTSYNPSPLEIELATAIQDLQNELGKKLSNKILEIKKNLNTDNPTLTFTLQDKDGDKHELVIKIIQRLDE